MTTLGAAPVQHRARDGSGVASAVGRALGSRAALVVVLVAFVVVGLFFAVTISVPSIVQPDERRHIGNIMFYAARSWTAGPFIAHQDPSTLALGEVTRFPSYLYYYLMSFPAKVMLRLGIEHQALVVGLRAIDVLAAAGGLAALRPLFRYAQVPAWIGLVAIIATGFTGRFAWQSAIVSYDSPSMAMFFVFAAVTVRFVRRGSLTDFAWMAVAAMGTLMLKYSLVPLLLAGIAFALLLRFRLEGFAWLRRAVPRGVARFRTHPVRSTVLVVVGLVLLALVVERFGINLLVYRSLNPDCALFHTDRQCMGFDIWSRNYGATRSRDFSAASGTLAAFHPLSFAWSWVRTYFLTLFFFWSPSRSWQPDPTVVGFGVVVSLAALVVTLTQLRRVLRSSTVWWLVLVSALYSVSVFCFNAATAVNLGRSFAFSGRYLLPVMPFIVAVLLLGVRGLVDRLPGALRVVAWVVVGLLGLALFLAYNPVSAFFPFADAPGWYSTWALRFLPTSLTGVES